MARQADEAVTGDETPMGLPCDDCGDPAPRALWQFEQAPFQRPLHLCADCATMRRTRYLLGDAPKYERTDS